ncbi:hypothetical protein MMC17_002541 [Xylographa soralifera]|nr:hypothetical protein [Xylographa soralifera]
MPFISLASKPQAPISYDITTPERGDEQSQVLVVFINGLGIPAASWRPVVSIMQASNGPHKPQMLTYDRFGQGATTARDPLDEQAGKEPGYGHDFVDATKDLHELLQAVVPHDTTSRRLILVAASIGVHLARLYAQHYPQQVAGLLILDSNIGNQELSDLWPNAQAPGFDPKDVVADDCTLEQYLQVSAKLPKIFNSDVKSPEGLDRRNVKRLLPEPGAPKLTGPDGRGVWLTVVGHDPEAFADESLKMMMIPRSLSMRFSNPWVQHDSKTCTWLTLLRNSGWNKYNEGLLGLTDADRSRGVVLASGCGHFIQKDNPAFVATQLEELLERVMSSK